MRGSFGDIRQSERDLARAHGLGAFMLPKMEGDSLSSSEDATRHNKASESVVSAFAAEGFGAPPAGLASMVADYINMSTRNIPIQKLASMTPGSGELGRVASAGVNIAIGSLTPDQREVMKAGGNPLNPADMASIGAKLGLAGYTLLASRDGSVGGNNGGRFAGMKEGSGDARRDTSFAAVQHMNALGKMSGSEFATQLGFQGDQARQFGALFNGTSGAFRSTAEEYKRVMGDPNATPEQQKAAAERMQRTAKTKKEKEAAKTFQEAIEKMKADGVDLNNKDAMKKYADEHPELKSILYGTDKAQSARVGNSKGSDKKAEQEVTATANAAPAKPDQKKALIQSKL